MIKIEMRGALESKYVEGSFSDLAHTLSLAGAKGQTFIVLTPRGGDRDSKLFNIEQILTAEEVDDDSFTSL